jgi:hypothetical protein
MYLAYSGSHAINLEPLLSLPPEHGHVPGGYILYRMELKPEVQDHRELSAPQPMLVTIYRFPLGKIL